MLQLPGTKYSFRLFSYYLIFWLGWKQFLFLYCLFSRGATPGLFSPTRNSFSFSIISTLQSPSKTKVYFVSIQKKKPNPQESVVCFKGEIIPTAKTTSCFWRATAANIFVILKSPDSFSVQSHEIIWSATSGLTWAKMKEDEGFVSAISIPCGHQVLIFHFSKGNMEA